MTTKKKYYGLKKLKNKIEKERGPITFGKTLEAFRKCEEMTQKELAKVLGISVSSLCDLEKGRKIPSPKRAYEMASTLKMCTSLWVQTAIQDKLRQQKINLVVSVA